MLHVGSGDGLLVVGEQEDTQGTLGLCTGRGDLCGVLLPFLATDGDIGLNEALILAHRVIIDEAHLENRRPALWAACPDREAVGCSLLDGNAEETFILKTCILVAVTGIAEADVVGVLVKGTIVAQLKVAIGSPAHQVLRKLERTVFHHLGIETAVGSVVDVFKEDAVHRRLYGSPQFLGVHVENVSLRCRQEAEAKQREGNQFSHFFSSFSNDFGTKVLIFFDIEKYSCQN